MGHSQRQLNQLSECLIALPPENDGMLLSELDGFVAGILVCPEMILPSEWLPIVWGEEIAPHFADMDQAKATLDAVMAHYNRVARGLAKTPTDYEAVYDKAPLTGDLMWEPWITGFERAMQLRPEAWEATVESSDEEIASSIPMLLALHDIAEGGSELAEDAIRELDAMAPDMIPDLVANLNAWVKAQGRGQGPANLPGAPAARAKVGRNDPCPCGSGRKFKKCCGAEPIY
jgi:uncharacterized protein